MAGDMPPGLRFAILARAFKRKMDERAREMGLTAVQLRVLGELSRLEAMGVEVNQKDLERAEQVTHPTMTETIKRLQKKGFVRCAVSDGDRRYKKITCTEKSASIYKELANQDEEVFEELAQGMTREQIETLWQSIGHILANIAREQSDHP